MKFAKKLAKMKLTMLPAAFFLFLMMASVGMTPVVAATSAATANSWEIWGTSSTAWTIYNELYETDSDVLTLITDNELSLFDSDWSISDLTIDWTETSVGKNTNDWTGTVGSDTDTADGGVNYWMANASTPDESAATGDGITWSTVSKTTPSSDGFYYTITGYSAEGAENSDEDREQRYWYLEDDLIDVEINSNSYFYTNLAVKFSGINETKDTRAYFWFTFSDGVNQIMLLYQWMGANTDDTAWTDFTVRSECGVNVVEEDAIVWTWDVAAANTYEECVQYYNIEDICQTSAAYPTFSPTSLVEFGVTFFADYAATAETITMLIKQFMIVDNVEDLSLFESTDLDDTAAQRNNNYPNATSRNIAEWDEYSLTDGLDFALDADIPLNRLTLSAYMPVISPATSTFTSASSTTLTVIREDVFDTDPPDDERLTMPTTLYGNMSSYSEDYEISQVTIATENFFSATGDIRESADSIVDRDSSPTIDSISDIYGNLNDLDGDLMFTDGGIAETNALTFDTEMEAPAGDAAYGTAGNVFAGLQQGLSTILQQDIFGYDILLPAVIIALGGFVGLPAVIMFADLTASEKKLSGEKKKAYERSNIKIIWLVTAGVLAILVLLSFVL